MQFTPRDGMEIRFDRSSLYKTGMAPYRAATVFSFFKPARRHGPTHARPCFRSGRDGTTRSALPLLQT